MNTKNLLILLTTSLLLILSGCDKQTDEKGEYPDLKNMRGLNLTDYQYAHLHCQRFMNFVLEKTEDISLGQEKFDGCMNSHIEYISKINRNS